MLPKGNLPISKLHSIFAVANLLAHNNISQICYCGQISLQSAAGQFFNNLTPLGGNVYFAGDGIFKMHEEYEGFLSPLSEVFDFSFAFGCVQVR